MASRRTAEAPPGRLYRFELVFDGEPQRVGIFTGIYSTGIPDARAERLVRSFVGLPAPDLDDRCEFWFTGEGVLRFKDALAAMIREIEPHGWTVATFVLDACPEGPLYSDEYQVALPPRRT